MTWEDESGYVRKRGWDGVEGVLKTAGRKTGEMVAPRSLRKRVRGSRNKGKEALAPVRPVLDRRPGHPQKKKSEVAGGRAANCNEKNEGRKKSRGVLALRSGPRYDRGIK